MSVFTHQLKRFLKKHFYYQFIKERFSPAAQIAQRQLYHYYKDCAAKGQLPPLRDAGYSIFSQFEEDGLILMILAATGMGNKTFLEIGADDGINSNCANWYFHFGFYGLFIDMNPESIRRGEQFYRKHPAPWDFPPKFVCARVSRDNINELIKQAGFSGEITLMSVDLDGIDYYIWEALNQVSPQIVIIETHNEFGLHDIVVPYEEHFAESPKNRLYHGASPVAMVKLAKHKGYRLVGANYYGFNFIFVKDGIAEDLIPEVPVESVLEHPAVRASREEFEAIKDWKYERNRYGNQTDAF